MKEAESDIADSLKEYKERAVRRLSSRHLSEIGLMARRATRGTGIRGMGVRVTKDVLREHRPELADRIEKAKESFGDRVVGAVRGLW